MEMTPDYLAETAEFLKSKGFSLHRDQDELLSAAGLLRTTRYHLERPGQELIFECLQYPDGEARFFLELYHVGLHTFSLPLDSWRFKDELLEVRYYTEPNSGTAMTFILHLDVLARRV